MDNNQKLLTVACGVLAGYLLAKLVSTGGVGAMYDAGGSAYEAYGDMPDLEDLTDPVFMGDAADDMLDEGEWPEDMPDDEPGPSRSRRAYELARKHAPTAWKYAKKGATGAYGYGKKGFDYATSAEGRAMFTRFDPSVMPMPSAPRARSTVFQGPSPTAMAAGQASSEWEAYQAALARGQASIPYATPNRRRRARRNGDEGFYEGMSEYGPYAALALIPPAIPSYLAYKYARSRFGGDEDTFEENRRRRGRKSRRRMRRNCSCGLP